MPAQLKKFCEVFEKINLTDDIKDSFKQTEISSLKISTGKKAMDLFLSHNKVLDEKHLTELENQMKESFPEMEHISVHLRYDFGESDTKKLISLIWKSILHEVSNTSHMCAKILNSSEWVVENSKLIITINYNYEFLFIRKRIPQLISGLIEKRLGISLNVDFIYKPGEKKKKTERKEHITYDIPKEPALPIKIQKPAPKPAPKDGFKQFSGKGGGRKETKLVESIDGECVLLSDKLEKDSEIIVNGEVISSETRETKSGNILVTADITDGTDSITIKFFSKADKFNEFKPILKNGKYLKVKGKVQFDEYSKELNIMANEIALMEKSLKRQDNAEQKRVELHLHTNMSAMDGMNTISDYLERAAAWGHRAIALTDHGVTQAYPEAMAASAKYGVKVLYGVEAYVIDDLASVVESPKGQTLNSTFIVFDIETTGLSKNSDEIIEIGAVKLENGVITDKFSTFVNPKRRIPDKITDLTGITNAMVENAPAITDVLPQFLSFVGDGVFVAHNASFDVGFVTNAAKRQNIYITNTVLDTLELSRLLFPGLNKHKLDVVARHLGVSLLNHHRAVDDAAATAEIFIKCLPILQEKGVNHIEEINAIASNEMDKSKLKHKHAIIFAKNLTGLHHLYELVSLSHLKYFFKRPRIPKSELSRLKEGLILGSACDAGELYTAIKENKPEQYINSIASFYDYYEIQPIPNCMYLVRDGQVSSMQDLININKRIVDLAKAHNKLAIATCDVHFLNPEDAIFRQILMTGEGFNDAHLQAPLYYRTTEEMLKEFEYLGEALAKEVVVTNTNLIADMFEDYSPIPSGKFPPHIDGCKEEIERLTMERARAVYSENLPEIVAARLHRELDSIIKNGFSVMYIAAQKLVSKSMEDGYLVGSRGSVGSSLVATLSGITEVNPLSPHYVCKSCKYSDFDSDIVKQFAGASGCDMPDKNCPNCGEPLHKDGHDIPFETFLGFDADKEPDIDLNFSGEYQLKAHQYAESLFGSENVFKAGTISTLAEKTAYGYVRKFLEEKGLNLRQAEINRLKIGCSGIKKTTGQHPGGLVILPKGHSIYEFCPVQRPANDTSSNITTTHFDYHSIEGRLLKLDLLGHDVPTIVRMLHDTSGVDPQTIDLGDKRIISLFQSPEALGVNLNEINCQTGTLGLPEFGTHFVRGMLMETKPTTFAELVRISGLSHGTDVWINNAQELVKEGIATLKEIIPTRDDIMVYLINKGAPRKDSFKIMESVRKGKGLTAEQEEIMRNANVDEWYIDSCKKIKYMFPKGHAVAYVMMTVRIGYYKIYHPYSFYAATFSVKVSDFNYETMCHGIDTLRLEMRRISSLGDEASAKDKASYTVLELVYEMYTRGFKFTELNLYEAQATKFTVTPNGLMPPLSSISGLGDSVAQNIVEARKDGEFITIEDFRERTKTNKTVIELLKKNGVFKGIPETRQLTLM